jgi:hypothetical protein
MRWPTRWAGVLLAVVVTLLVRALRRTWRIRVIGAPPAEACLYAFWHGHQVALTAAAVSPTVLVSRSRDGQWAALVARWLGFGVVRGSSSRGAVSGAMALVRRLLRGEAAAIAVDGPRGPGYRAGDGALRLARRAGVPLVPVVASCSRGLQLSTWDRLLIPAPFATVRVCFGPPVRGMGVQPALEAAGCA